MTLPAAAAFCVTYEMHVVTSRSIIR